MRGKDIMKKQKAIHNRQKPIKGFTLKNFYIVSNISINAQTRGAIIPRPFLGAKSFKGFTLLEMVVAVGVFAVAAVLGVSSYLALTGAQKKALTLQSIQNNLRFVIESMARDIRVGSYYHCGMPPSVNPLPWSSKVTPQLLPWDPQECDSDGTPGGTLAFVRRGSAVIVYRSRDCGGGHYCIERGEANGVMPLDADFVPMTSRDIEIGSAGDSGLRFFVIGADHKDFIPGRVTIYIHGTAHLGKEASTFDIQTTVSQFQILRDLQ